jgi:hypothetical protein
MANFPGHFSPLAKGSHFAAGKHEKRMNGDGTFVRGHDLTIHLSKPFQPTGNFSRIGNGSR